MKKFNLVYLTTLLIALLFVPRAHADFFSVNFEPSTYTVGNINGQDGWSKTGPFDVAVVNNTYEFGTFGTQSLRVSDAVTSGSFGDQTFAKPLVNSVGEIGSTNGTFSPGTKQPHFEMQFDIASTQSTEQSGMHMSVSPDRGDGSRMSYLRFYDSSSGINVFFDDVQQTVPCTSSGCANFVETLIGTISRTPHTIKLTMDTLDGSSNDVVKVWIDGVLAHTGTSWEDYYRYDPEAFAEQSPRIVKTVLFRESGTANAGHLNNGFLVDNLSLLSGATPVSTVKVTIDKFIDGTMATAVSANNSAFPMSATWNATNIGAGTGSYALSTVGFNNPNPYEAVTADMSVGANYSTNEVTGGAVVGASCAAGKPYALVGYSTGDTLSAAQAAAKSTTIPSFTNLLTNKYVIVWNEDCATPNPFAVPVACQGPTYGAPIVGTNGSNTINGTSGNDLIFARGGNDTVNGGGGNDCIVGGAGSDTLRGGNGKDVLLGEEGTDTLDGGNNEDKLYGGEGTDILSGGNESDTLSGDNGTDSLDGGNGNDTLMGGDGNDSMRGGNGTDSLDGGGDTDSANGGTGNQDVCIAESKSACEL